MDNIRIIGYSTTPENRLNVSGALLDLIESTINKKILAKYTFLNVKSKIFEIMLSSEVETNKRKVVQLSKTGRGEFFSFRFFIPYSKATKKGEIDIPVFINEFMEAIREALSQFNTIPDALIDKIKKQLIAKTEGKKEYVYVEPEDDKLLRKIVNEVSRQFEAGELHKSL